MVKCGSILGWVNLNADSTVYEIKMGGYCPFSDERITIYLKEIEEGISFYINLLKQIL